MEQPATTPSFVGIDVSKERLDVHVRPSGQAFAIARDSKALEQLVSDLRALAPALIVLEATGGFELTVAAALAGAGLPLAVVNPRQIRDFARATGRLAKTDALDAPIIALFAERIRPEPRPLADADSQTLAELEHPCSVAMGEGAWMPEAVSFGLSSCLTRMTTRRWVSGALRF